MMRDNEKHNQIKCRKARTRFSEMARYREEGNTPIHGSEMEALEQHLAKCDRCADEYNLFSLGRTVVLLATTAEPVSPTDDFIAAIRTRIISEEVARSSNDTAENWLSTLWTTARQFALAMSFVLLLIVGATIFWEKTSPIENNTVSSPEITLLGDPFNSPKPTQDDVINALVVGGEKENGN